MISVHLIIRTLYGLLFCVLLPAFSQAQIMFERHYGGSGDEIAGDVQQTADGGFIITGQTNSFGDSNGDVYLIKTNEYGDTLWTTKYGGPQFDGGMAVKQTNDGGYIIAGSTESFGAGQLDAYLIRLNVLGDTVWTRTFGGTLSDEVYDVIETSDGFALIGYSMSYATVFSSVYLIKTDFNGNLSWHQNYERSDVNVANEFTQTQDNGFFIAATIKHEGAGQKSKIWLIKTNEFGDTIWSKEIENDTSSLIVSSVGKTVDGGYILGGAVQDPTGEIDALVIKTDNNGIPQWSRRYDLGGEERAACIRTTNDDNYIISGLKDYSSKNQSVFPEYSGQNMLISDDKLISADVLIIKINQNGDTLWTKTFGGSGNDWSRKIAQTYDNGYIVLGFAYSSDCDFYLIKTREDGVALINEHNYTDLMVFPNPTKGLLHLKLQPGSEFPLPYSIYNIAGRTIAWGELCNENQTITIPYKGVCIITFQKNGISFSKKIIVE